MENVTPEKKQPIIKILAITGLFAIVILAAWLAIQIVTVLPKAIDSLASIANSVYNHNPLQEKNIEVAADKTVLKTNEAITLSWPEQKNPGVYTFSYTCEDNVSLSLSTVEKNIPLLSCDKDYELGSTTAVALAAKSEAKSVVDITYKISYFRTNDPTPSATHSGVLTITNPDLDEPIVEKPTTAEEVTSVATSTVEAVATSSPSTEEVAVAVPVVEEVSKPVIATSTPKVTPKPSTKPAPMPVPAVPTFIYKVPVSDPNGTVDLSVVYLGLKTQSGSDSFSKLNTIKQDRAGVLQFSVHNIGTKTSGTWKFNATLPGGTTYESATLTALKPNERAVFTIEFPAITRTGKTEAEIEVETATDRNKNNNSFNTGITVTK